MDNEQDSKKKDTPIPEEELFDELDAMYQRVADIEKEEATEILPSVEPKSSSTPGTRVGSEKASKKKSGPNKKRSYRPVILGAIAVFFALILGVTLWKPTAILQLLRIGDVQQPTVPSRPAPRKPSGGITPKTSPIPPSVAPSPAAPQPPSAAAPPSTTPPPAAVAPPAPSVPPVAATSLPPSIPAQKQEAVKKAPEEAERAKPAPQEMVKSDKSVSQKKHFAIQIGSFREMEHVRNLVDTLKKEGLDAFWITSESKKRGTLYKVFVGRFTDRNEAAQFQKDKTILKNYPDSFIQEVSTSRTGP